MAQLEEHLLCKLKVCTWVQTPVPPKKRQISRVLKRKKTLPCFLWNQENIQIFSLLALSLHSSTLNTLLNSVSFILTNIVSHSMPSSEIVKKSKIWDFFSINPYLETKINIKMKSLNLSAVALVSKFATPHNNLKVFSNYTWINSYHHKAHCKWFSELGENFWQLSLNASKQYRIRST